MEETPLNYNEVIETIKSLSEQNDSSKWIIGDLINALTINVKRKSDLKNLLTEISGDTNLEYTTLYQYRWVSKKFPEDTRSISPVLTYSHYRAVVTLEDAVTVLTKAADEAWTVSKLKETVVSNKETKKIEDELTKCSRSGCTNNISLDPNYRVHVNIYGYKLVCCSCACAGNVIINILRQAKDSCLEIPISAETSQTYLVRSPNISKYPEITWESERTGIESKFLESKYGEKGYIH